MSYIVNMNANVHRRSTSSHDSNNRFFHNDGCIRNEIIRMVLVRSGLEVILLEVSFSMNRIQS